LERLPHTYLTYSVNKEFGEEVLKRLQLLDPSFDPEALKAQIGARVGQTYNSNQALLATQLAA
jgi:hypothetical protein